MTFISSGRRSLTSNGAKILGFKGGQSSILTALRAYVLWLKSVDTNTIDITRVDKKEII
jgi:hypothetical protein